MKKLITAILSVIWLTGIIYGGVAEDLRSLAGTHARAVWIQDQGSGNDVFGKKAQHILRGVDTDDGRGVRTILSTVACYNKPLITPKGDRVVYSDWVNNKVYVVGFNGGTPRFVVNGFCSDVWQHPSTGEEWVYVATSRTSSNYADIYRYKLDNPGSGELIWNKTRVGISYGTWFQASVDGTKGAGSFPWSNCGMAALPNTSWSRTAGGCWTAMSPATDDYMWVFDGLHRNVNLYTAAGSHIRLVDLHNAPGIRGWEIYHPKWSNHKRFFTMTGPYTGGSTSSCASSNCGNKISAGGTQLEAYVGRFNSAGTAVDGWVKLTADDKADYYPDVWIDPGTVEPGINLSPGSLEFYAVPGGSNPNDKNVTVSAVGGQSLDGLTATDNAGWLTVQITGSGNTRTLANKVNAGTAGNGIHNATVTVKAGSITKTYTVKLTVSALHIKMNAGANTVSGWQSMDGIVSGGSDYSNTKTYDLSGVTSPGPMELYHTCRHMGPDFIFGDVPDGSYTVRLHYADPSNDTGGLRKMVIRIEDETVETAFNIQAAAGGNGKAVVKEYGVTVSDGNGLKVEYDLGTGNDAFVSGIEIIARTTAMIPEVLPAGTGILPEGVYINLQGKVIPENSLPAGMYIIRTGASLRKVLITE